MVFGLGLMAGMFQLHAAPARPNILIILVDDMGFSDLGCYGSEINTPNLDALAKESLRYTRFYNCSRCCPSRAALMTGLYPHQAGVGDMVDQYAARVRQELDSPAYTDRLDPQTPTIAEVLQGAGYETAMVGKWHLGYRPEEWPSARGFEHSFAQIEGAMNYYGYGPQHSLPRGERGFLPMELDGKPFTPPTNGFFTTDVYTDFAVRQIRGHGETNKPLFLYVAYNAPHWPLQARPDTIAKYRHTYDAGWDEVRELRYERLLKLGMIGPNMPNAPRPDRLPAWEKLAPKKQKAWRDQMAVYAAQVEEMDSGVGRIMDALRASGQETNTLVIFFSDNGGAAERPFKTINNAPLGSRDSFLGYDLEGAHVSCTPLRRTKSFVHEGGISSPLIVHWPGGIPAARDGSLINDTADIMDMMASCVDLAGAKFPEEWHGGKTKPPEGISLVPSFTGQSLQRGAPLFWEHEGNHAVLDGKWKLVAERGDPWELYDMETDRTESHNLAAEQPERVKQLEDEYKQWTQRIGVLPWPQPGSKAQAARRDALLDD
jgi:arylsulfatase